MEKYTQWFLKSGKDQIRVFKWRCVDQDRTEQRSEALWSSIEQNVVQVHSAVQVLHSRVQVKLYSALNVYRTYSAVQVYTVHHTVQ